MKMRRSIWIHSLAHSTETFHYLSLVGLAIILVGLCSYRYENRELPEGLEEAVQIFPGAMEAPAFTLRRKAAPLVRCPQTIRSGFYGRE